MLACFRLDYFNYLFQSKVVNPLSTGYAERGFDVVPLLLGLVWSVVGRAVTPYPSQAQIDSQYPKPTLLNSEHPAPLLHSTTRVTYIRHTNSRKVRRYRQPRDQMTLTSLYQEHQLIMLIVGRVDHNGWEAQVRQHLTKQLIDLM